MTSAPQPLPTEENGLDEPPVSCARPLTLELVQLARMAPANDIGSDAQRRALPPDDRALLDFLAERFASAWLRLHR